MDPRTRDQGTDDIRRRCREHGLPLTSQRLLVLEAILDLDTHPTADQVHKAVSRLNPAVSRATVYRTLDSLTRAGVITKACHPGKAIRYDSLIETHHHLVCLRCGTVIDIADERLDALPVPDTSSFGFEIRDFRVQLRGLCRRCRELEETQ